MDVDFDFLDDDYVKKVFFIIVIYYMVVSLGVFGNIIVLLVYIFCIKW